MIGQEELLKKLKELKEKDKFPKFLIMQGGRGYGKKLICKEIAKLLNLDIVFFDNKVDDVRECIQLAYTQISPIIYVLKEGDSMSIAAKNSLLKLVEEPPTSAHIILLVENEENMLRTILSRAFEVKMDPYTLQELRTYINNLDNEFTPEEVEEFVSICECPGEIKLFLQPESKDLLSFCKKIVDNLPKVTLSNALKIPKKIKYNEASEGFDINLFFNTLSHLSFKKFLETRDLGYQRFCLLISQSKGMILRPSINKLYVLDNLVIKGWQLWNYGN